MFDPDFSSDVVDALVRNRFIDYASNVGVYTDGLDTEALSFTVLREVAEEAMDPQDREHVTRFIRMRPLRFRMMDVYPDDWWPGPKLSVDTQEDLDRVRAIYVHLEPGKFSMRDTLDAWEKAGRP